MNTLQCKACNASIPSGARFCGRCGKYIDVDRVDTKPLSIDQDAPTLLTDDLFNGWGISSQPTLDTAITVCYINYSNSLLRLDSIE